MIDMRVGEENLLERHLALVGFGEHALDLASRVDHRAPPAVLVPDERAILLERRDGNDERAHQPGTIPQQKGSSGSRRRDDSAVTCAVPVMVGTISPFARSCQR